MVDGEETINAAVVRALEAVATHRRGAIGARVPRGFQHVMRGMPGSVWYNLLRDGRPRCAH